MKQIRQFCKGNLHPFKIARHPAAVLVAQSLIGIFHLFTAQLQHQL